MAEGRFVAYYRVSTRRQGESGLGLQAQETAVREFLNGGDWKLLATFREVESGGNDDRPQLQKALHKCRLCEATLLVAKLDRLSRDAAFLMNLQKSGAKFTACDMPEANQMTVGILALVAEYERQQISNRIKVALAETKKRGTTLGNPNGAAALVAHVRKYGNGPALAAIQNNARQRKEDLQGIIAEMQGEGLSLRQMAKKLTDSGIITPRGGYCWSHSTLASIIRRN